MLNDFDDEHSASEAGDLSMMSVGRRVSMGISYNENTRLEPSSKLMAGMAAPSNELTKRISSAYVQHGEN